MAQGAILISQAFSKDFTNGYGTFCKSYDSPTDASTAASAISTAWAAGRAVSIDGIIAPPSVFGSPNTVTSYTATRVE